MSNQLTFYSDTAAAWERSLTACLGEQQRRSAATDQWPSAYGRRVPRILRGPGIRPGVYEEPVALVDIAPTLAQVLALPVPAGLEGAVLEGAIAR